jgi:hypothetical protein
MAEIPFSGNKPESLPEWQMQLIDQRLKAIAENPERLRPINELLDALEKKIKWL